MTRFITSYTGAIRSNMARTRSGGSVPLSIAASRGPLTCVPMGHSRSVSRSGAPSPCIPMCHLLPPAPNQHIVDTKLIQSSRNNEVEQVVDRLGAVVEARREEQDRRARASGGQHGLEVDRRERRLAGHQYELPLLLQRDRRGAIEHGQIT